MLRPLNIFAGLLALWCGMGDSPPRPMDARGPGGQEKTSSEWVIHRGDQRLSGVAPGQLARELQLLWTYQADGPIVSAPVVANGRAYFGSDDMKVHCVDIATGLGVWTYTTGEMIEAPALVHDGVVYIGSGDFWFYALDAASGQLRWKMETGERIVGGANWFVARDGSTRIVVGSHDNRLYCLNATTGAIVWIYETVERVNATPAVLGDQIVFGGCDCNVHVVDAETGVGRAKIFLGEEANIAGSVAVDGAEVYVSHMGHELVRVDIATGAVTWRFSESQFPFYGAPALASDRVVVAGRDKIMHCVRRDTGKQIWSFLTRRKVDGSPVICGEKVVFGSGDGRIYVISIEDGTETWSYDVGQPVYSSPAVADGMILIGGNDGRLYAFGPKSVDDQLGACDGE